MMLTEARSEIVFREGDIFRWSDLNKERSEFYSHCRSHIAIFRAGKLCDTYWNFLSCYRPPDLSWSFPDPDSVLDPEDVLLKPLGNIDELRAIYPAHRSYYHAQDIVDLRHSNAPNAPVFIRKYARRSLDAVLEHFTAKLEGYRAEAEFASRRATECQSLMQRISSGEIDLESLLP